MLWCHEESILHLQKQCQEQSVPSFYSAHVMTIIPKQHEKEKIYVILNLTVHYVSISVHEIRVGTWRWKLNWKPYRTLFIGLQSLVVQHAFLNKPGTTSHGWHHPICLDPSPSIITQENDPTVIPPEQSDLETFPNEIPYSLMTVICIMFMEF